MMQHVNLHQPRVALLIVPYGIEIISRVLLALRSRLLIVPYGIEMEHVNELLAAQQHF